MPRHDPTPDQIRKRCLEVQSKWDERTRKARALGVHKKDVPTGWTPPTIAAEELMAILDDHHNSGSKYN